MKIENKEVYSLFKAMFKSGKIDAIMQGGLLLEGFDGGVAAYVTNGRAIYRKIFYGNNKAVFVTYFDSWTTKTGSIDTETLHSLKTEYNTRLFEVTKSYFELDRFNSNRVDFKEFKQAVKGVAGINRNEYDKSHKVAISLHNGKMDIAAWYRNEYDVETMEKTLEYGFWQLEGNYSGEGALLVNKKYIAGIPTSKDAVIAYSIKDYRIILNISGEYDAVIMPMAVEEEDKAEFKEVMEYDYSEAPELAAKKAEREAEILAAIAPEPVQAAIAAPEATHKIRTTRTYAVSIADKPKKQARIPRRSLPKVKTIGAIAWIRQMDNSIYL